MLFRTDKQTISDIELFSQNAKNPSLFEFYNRTETIGGREYLYKVIRTPFSDRTFLENRKAEIKYILNLKHSLKLNKRQFDFAEYYLINRHIPLRNNFIDAIYDSIVNALKMSNDYYVIKEGIIHLSGILNDLKKFLYNIQNTNPPKTLNEAFNSALDYLNGSTISKFLSSIPNNSRKLKSKQINQLDNFFRAKKNKELRSVLDTMYEIDVLQSHCRLLKEEHFCLPEYSNEENPIFEAKDCMHPLLIDPKPNSFRLDRKRALCFITGPNMSGKTTFLRTVAILTYFAHLGIPVPATRLKIPMLNGLFTTINLSDSLSQGFSHFFAEVNRIKELAVEIKDNKNIVLILDELFRGTNVKDAYDGTLMVISLLSKIKGSFFFISTHILEVAENLANSNTIDFKCFESILSHDKPIYDYKLKEGITTERVGIQIIKNEKIEEILNEIIKKQN
jgi:DNA mismatch repair protein MutS